MNIIASIEYLIKVEKKFKVGELKIYLNNEDINCGYVWVFSKTENIANIGICGKGNLSDKFSKFLSEVVLKEYGDYSILENRSGIIPVQGKEVQVYKKNMMLVGDAAGFADPLFKGGMSQAMQSAKIAAECILNKNVYEYESKIKSMPFVDSKLIEASNVFYAMSNNTLNELGEVLDGKRTSYIKSFSGIRDCILKKHLRKDFFKVMKFFSVWSKKHDYLW